MEKPRFDQLTRTIAATGTRRMLTQGLAALLLSAQAVSLPDDATARRKHRRARPQAEKKHKKTVILCLNGETIEVKKSKKQKYLKQGATLGACQTCNAGSWVKETDFGSFGAGPDQFDYPNSVAIAANGLTAWVADAQNSRISVWARPTANSTAWSNTGTVGTPGGSGPSNVFGPECVRVSADEKTMWIMDTLNNRVSVWTRPDASAAWANQTTFGSDGNGPDQFDFPSRMAVSADDLTVWVVDHGHNRISVWGRPSAGSTVWGHKGNFGALGSGPNDLHGPTGVAVDQDGLTAWVSDYGNDRISVWERPNAGSDTWSNETIFGASGSANGVDQPLGLAVSPDGLTAWICDNHGTQRVSIWTRPNAGSTAWAYAGAFGSPCADIALSPDFRTAFLAEPSTNSISVWTMTCPA
ncbi:MAG: hypothetical protein M3Z20_12305 [Chloroflexota bacterium]|nr:hypothetical protein [Chloroflexota bacterium]